MTEERRSSLKAWLAERWKIRGQRWRPERDGASGRRGPCQWVWRTCDWGPGGEELEERAWTIWSTTWKSPSCAERRVCMASWSSVESKQEKEKENFGEVHHSQTAKNQQERENLESTQRKGRHFTSPVTWNVTAFSAETGIQPHSSRGCCGRS